MKSLRVVCLLGMLSLVLMVFTSPPIPHPTLSSALAGPTEPLDLKAATAEQLKALPGIGDAYAAPECSMSVGR